MELSQELLYTDHINCSSIFSPTLPPDSHAQAMMMMKESFHDQIWVLSYDCLHKKLFGWLLI